MIKEIKHLEDLNAVSGGVSVVRSVRIVSRSGSTSRSETTTVSDSPASSFSNSESAFDRFFARREAARARNAQREQEQEARASSGSTGGGFPASAALGLP